MQFARCDAGALRDLNRFVFLGGANLRCRYDDLDKSRGYLINEDLGPLAWTKGEAQSRPKAQRSGGLLNVIVQRPG